MSQNVIFDCTQFITFNYEGKNSFERYKSDFESIGLEVRERNGVNYGGKSYFKEDINDIVIELFDQEFLGEFEDWKEINNPPEKIVKLIRILENIIDDRLFNEFKVILVSACDEVEEDNEVYRVNSSKENLKENLFLMSFYNFEDYYEIVMINLIFEN